MKRAQEMAGSTLAVVRCKSNQTNLGKGGRGEGVAAELTTRISQRAFIGSADSRSALPASRPQYKNVLCNLVESMPQQPQCKMSFAQEQLQATWTVKHTLALTLHCLPFRRFRLLPIRFDPFDSLIPFAEGPRHPPLCSLV